MSEGETVNGDAVLKAFSQPGDMANKESESKKPVNRFGKNRNGTPLSNVKSDEMEIPDETWAPESLGEFGHPALMPEALAEDLIISYSRPGTLVLDPMCGAATTCKMALVNGRRYIGIEIDERYAALAEARLASAREEYKKRLDDRFDDDDRPAYSPN